MEANAGQLESKVSMDSRLMISKRNKIKFFIFSMKKGNMHL